jgi:hypothetical protein
MNIHKKKKAKAKDVMSPLRECNVRGEFLPNCMHKILPTLKK